MAHDCEWKRLAELVQKQNQIALEHHDIAVDLARREAFEEAVRIARAIADECVGPYNSGAFQIVRALQIRAESDQ